MRSLAFLLALGASLLAGGAFAQPAPAKPASAPAETEVPEPRPPSPGLFDSGKLLATGGVTQLEGAGGGGLAPWALITGYGSTEGIGANVHYTNIPLRSFGVQGVGGAVGFYDRAELSYTRIWFDTQAVGGKLGIGRNFTFQQDVFGAKVRVAGDAVYGQDQWWPQIALGLQYKRTDHGDILRAVGAKSDEGVDFYVAATKLLLDDSLLANVTVRATRANQLGILGFGGDRTDVYRPQVETSVAYLVSRELAVGVEYRAKPDNLSFAREDGWFDAFFAYFINKNVSLTAAFVDLGSIATADRQRGAYLSIQAGL